jgi:hypothetical protein
VLFLVDLPSDLRGYRLEKETGSSIIKKLIILTIIALALMYFFKRPWFDFVVTYVKNIF